jgi:hypothetical protein
MAAMIYRALTIWFGILILANINGAVREAWLIPALGSAPGRALSTIFLSTLVFLVSGLTITWIAPPTARHALLVGVLWLLLTLAFEFLVGHYVFHKPWADLTEDYHCPARSDLAPGASPGAVWTTLGGTPPETLVTGRGMPGRGTAIVNRPFTLCQQEFSCLGVSG